MNNILLLASQSQSRRRLLADAAIPFVLLDQSADEKSCDWTLPLQELVLSIAKHKMEQIIMPKSEDGKELFVVTADTLTQDLQGNILGKPESREDAIAMLKAVRAGARVGTAFCLDKKVYRFDSWQTQQRILTFVEAQCVFNVPDMWMNDYLDHSFALTCSGSISLDGYGAQFFRSVYGSYTTVLGLPMTELRQALEKIGFFYSTVQIPL
jgi:septum formation protein